jgi:hypothetical protein
MAETKAEAYRVQIRILSELIIPANQAGSYVCSVERATRIVQDMLAWVSEHNQFAEGECLVGAQPKWIEFADNVQRIDAFQVEKVPAEPQSCEQ